MVSREIVVGVVLVELSSGTTKRGVLPALRNGISPVRSRRQVPSANAHRGS